MHQEWPVDETASLLLQLNISSLTTPIDTLDTNSLGSHAHANPPPLINWSMRPRQTSTNNVLQESSGTAGGSPMCFPVDDALEQLLHHPARHPCRRFSLPLSELQDGCDEASEWQELTATFTRLSMSNNPASSTVASFRAQDGRDEPSELQNSTAANTAASFWACTPPGSSATRLSSPKKGSKYYTIIVGKCTGVYYGEWYVNI